MLSSTEATMPQWTAGTRLARPVFLQVGEADRDDQEGLEAFAQGDDERLQHESAVPESATESRFCKTTRRSPTSQVRIP